MHTMQAYQQYRTTEAQTAGRGDLVVMLYEGAIRFLYRASTAMRADDLEEAHNNVIRGQDIIAELMGTLNLDTGELAYNLFRIYEYMHYRLVEANIHKDAEPIEEVTRLLRELLPAWQQVAREARTTKADIPMLAGRRLSLALA
ncbi:MAG: flagellar export chaperone FliS [Bacteroidetes bacterium]|nr:flagellar export chaperone FliS [Bacteroidota bacterium]MCL5025230.1 flagellar export chaperone FliS [Chloroflexota bacterium]